MNVKEDLGQVQCELIAKSLDVNGNEQTSGHFIPLTFHIDLEGAISGYTGGQELTWYVEPGPIQIRCLTGAGPDRGSIGEMRAHLSGTLIPK